MDSGSDSDAAPDELTAFEGVKQHEETEKVERENVIRVAREGKDRRRRWAQRKAPAKKVEQTVAVQVVEQHEEEAPVIPGMLPKGVIDALAAREKITFSSDSEEEIVNQKAATRKKRPKTFGSYPIVLGDVGPVHCMQNSMEFLERRKMQVPRSSSVLKNANQALRLLSSKGNLLSKS